MLPLDHCRLSLRPARAPAAQGCQPPCRQAQQSSDHLAGATQCRDLCSPWQVGGHGGPFVGACGAWNACIRCPNLSQHSSKANQTARGHHSYPFTWHRNVKGKVQWSHAALDPEGHLPYVALLVVREGRAHCAACILLTADRHNIRRLLPGCAGDTEHAPVGLNGGRGTVCSTRVVPARNAKWWLAERCAGSPRCWASSNRSGGAPLQHRLGTVG